MELQLIDYKFKYDTLKIISENAAILGSALVILDEFVATVAMEIGI